MRPQDEFRQFEPSEWSARVSNLIQGAIDPILREQSDCSVMLTGGSLSHRESLPGRNRFLFWLQGKRVAQVLAKALQEPGDVATLPARLIIGATWLLDSPLFGDGF